MDWYIISAIILVAIGGLITFILGKIANDKNDASSSGPSLPHGTGAPHHKAHKHKHYAH